VAAVREHHPRLAGSDLADLKLTDAQFVLARLYGFPSWPALREHLEMVAVYARSPERSGHEHDPGDPARELLRLGCLLYGGDGLSRHQEARALLAAQPDLAGASIWTAAAVGDVDAATRFLSADPGLAGAQGGPFEWEPLLYLAYSRIDSPAPAHDPLAVARLLLAHGADPDAGYLWDGNYPFTALTGAFGGGEDRGNQPPHRQSLELARLLLEAGADPNDSQALYNRQFDPDPSHLRLLIEFGLGQGKGGPWHTRLRSGHGTPAELLEDQLLVAAFEGRAEWARLALDAGADPDGLGTRHPARKGLTPLEAATRQGNREVAALLLAAGAAPVALDPVDALLAAALAADEAEVGRLTAASPALAEAARAQRPEAMVLAAELGRPDAVRLLARLGFDVNARGRITALHQAAYDGNVALARVLLELGADPTITDTSFSSTPEGWADHNHQDEMVAFLKRAARPAP
jgi:ankyrin repeat protein